MHRFCRSASWCCWHGTGGRRRVVGFQPHFPDRSPPRWAGSLDGVGRSAIQEHSPSALERRWIVLAIAVVLFVGFGHASYPHRLGTDLVPDLWLRVSLLSSLRLPEGTTLELQRPRRSIGSRTMLVDDPAFASVFSMVGSLPSAASGRRTLGENLAQVNFRMTTGETDAEDEAAAVATRALRQLPASPAPKPSSCARRCFRCAPRSRCRSFRTTSWSSSCAAETRCGVALERPARGPRCGDDLGTRESRRSWSSSTGSGQPPLEFRRRIVGNRHAHQDPRRRGRRVPGWERSGSTSGLRAGERFRSLASGVQALRIILPERNHGAGFC